jgi:hypothetical protein
MPINVSGNYYLINDLQNNSGVCFNINASDIYFDCQGNLVNGSILFGYADVGFSAFNLSYYTNITIKNCRISEWTNDIHLINVENSLLQNNSLSSYTYGINLQSVNNTLFENMSIYYGRFPTSQGILATQSNYNIFDGLSVTDNDMFGIDFDNRNYHNVVKNSYFQGNNIGIVQIGGGDTNTMHNLTIDNNTFFVSEGILFEITDGNTIKNNNFSNILSDVGIYMANKVRYNQIINNTFEKVIYSLIMDDDASYNNITGNKMQNCTWGIRMWDWGDINKNSSYNRFWDNLFNCTENFHHQGEHYLNYFNTTLIFGNNIVNGSYIGGNYWNDYTGNDSNGDGIGDTPYVINETYMIDYLPLIYNFTTPTPPIPPNVTNNSLPIITSLGISECCISPADAVTFTIYATDPESDTIGYAYRCFDAQIISAFTGTNTGNCTYNNEGTYTLTVYANDTNHTDWNSFSQNVTALPDITGVCGGICMQTNLIDVADKNKGLMPQVYFGLFGFFQQTLSPMLVLGMVIFFTLIMIMLGVIIKKIAQQVVKLGN